MNEVKERMPGQEPKITVAQFQAMLIKICPLGVRDIENLGEIILECQEDAESRTLTCSEFLRIMRKVVDTNLGNILGKTADKVAERADKAADRATVHGAKAAPNSNDSYNADSPTHRDNSTVKFRGTLPPMISKC